tara:strand:+ start:1774 stop:2688 length:915 start_codon:yes stop_codon:yes gene_type:complete
LKNILFFTEIYKDLGSGNLVRSLHLLNFLKKKSPQFKLFLSIDDSGLIKETNLLDNKVDVISLNELKNFFFDCVIYDSSNPNIENINFLNNISKKIVALDFFNYEIQINSIINLYCHNSDNLNKFKGNLYSGLNYAIISEKIIKSKIKKNNFKNRILVSFGGEDPKNNTLKVLDYLNKINEKSLSVRVLVGELNKNKKEILKYNKLFKVTGHTNKIHEIYKKTDVIICGGGTTLLEALFLNIPAIVLPQNKFEEKFVLHISKNTNIFKLSNLKNISKIFEKMKKNSHKSVDGMGKKRISKIILS